MSHHPTPNAVTTTSLMALSLAVLFVAQHFYSAPAATTAAAPQGDEPIAVVKSILLNGKEEVVVPPGDMKITRLSAEDQAGQAGMLLSGGDEVSTGPNAKATILFLDAAPENDNEVLVDANTRIRIGSVFDWFGKILVRSKGGFDTATPKLSLNTKATEYELLVQGDGTNRLRVLEGAVQVQKGTFSPTSHLQDWEHIPEQIFATGNAQFVRSSFKAQQRRAQQVESTPGKIQFVAIAGKTTAFDQKFEFANCGAQKHLFELRGPRNLTWFQITGADKFDIPPNGSTSISFVIKANTTGVPVGVYEGDIIAHCLDCATDPACRLAGLLLPISVKVVGPGGSSDASTQSSARSQEPGAATQSSAGSRKSAETIDQGTTVGQKLQEVVLAPDNSMVRREASVDQIDETLAWSNDVILAAQPSYSAQSVIPRLQTAPERGRQFREARRGAILSGDPLSYETLGAIYVDWGNGAKAVDQLQKAVGAAQTPERIKSLGEAYRLTGDLQRAESILTQAVRLYPGYAPGFNSLGNVYLDQARIAQDQKDYEGAQRALRTASDQYSRAKANDPASIVSQSNLGETNLQLGDIAREQGRLDEALAQYKLAEQAFREAEENAVYVFATKGLGDTYRGMANVGMLSRDRVLTREAIANSENKYSQALRAHGDFSQAYVGLGNLYEDTGRKDEAIRMYRRAIAVRPEVPQSYYYFARSIADRNPSLAAAYAKAYLKLERAPYKKGEKARNARELTEPRPPPTPTPTPTVTPSPSPTGTPVKVPDVRGNKSDEAIRSLGRRGLTGELRDQADCAANGKVLAINPRQGEKVQPGTKVIVFISALGENAVPVPDLYKRPLNEVEDELRNLGLNARVRHRVENNAFDENTVVDQKPKANGKLNPGCTVELTISIKVQPVPVPNYVGLSKADAFNQLNKYFGQLLRGDVTEEDSEAPPGTVISQNPQAGDMVPPGTRVNLVLSRSTIVVPDLRGMSEAQAKNYLAQMNGRLILGSITYKEVPYGKPFGVVMDQAPLPNRPVPIGTPINLIVSQAPKGPSD
jgi:beta-lactam-binding protein with PASTA domain/Flp pilus assembly protein TadD